LGEGGKEDEERGKRHSASQTKKGEIWGKRGKKKRDNFHHHRLRFGRERKKK